MSVPPSRQAWVPLHLLQTRLWVPSETKSLLHIRQQRIPCFWRFWVGFLVDSFRVMAFLWW